MRGLGLGRLRQINVRQVRALHALELFVYKGKTQNYQKGQLRVENVTNCVLFDIFHILGKKVKYAFKFAPLIIVECNLIF